MFTLLVGVPEYKENPISCHFSFAKRILYVHYRNHHIVVITSVTEGVIRPNDVLLQLGAFRNNGYGAVAPSVVGIGADLITVCIVDRDNIPLQILLKVEGIEDVSSIALGSVLHSNGRAAFVMEVDQEMIAPCLADDLISI